MSTDQENINQAPGAPIEYNSLDVGKIYAILKRSLVWILIIMVVTNVLAFLVLRWTKPVYQASSNLKIDFKNEANALGIDSRFTDQNLNNISGEIELLRSNLFFSKVIDNIDLDVSYFTPGNVLNDEKYRSSPIRVECNLKTGKYFDEPIRVRFEENNSFSLLLNEEESPSLKGTFGTKISSQDFDLVLHKTGYFDSYNQGECFFIVNSEASLISYLSKNLTVAPLNLKANTISISFKDYNQRKALDIVEVVDSTYLEYSISEKAQENNQKITWLDNELSGIEKKLEGLEDYFEDFTVKNRTNDLDSDIAKILGVINEIDTQLTATRKQIAYINKFEKNFVGDSVPINILTNSETFPPLLNDKIEAFNVKLERFNNTKLNYSANTHVYKKAEGEIVSDQKIIYNALMEYRSQLNQNLQDLLRLRAQMEEIFQGLPSKSTDFNKTKRFYGIYEQLYLNLMQTKIEFEIARAGTKNNIIILSNAYVHPDPVSPKKVLFHGIGVVSGLLFSLMFIGIRYVLNNRITNVTELERLTGATILGSIPKYNTDKGIVNFLVHKMPKSSVSESLRTIRTNISFLFEGEGTKLISVTSTISGEGKTFVAANLGGITALTNKRVVLVDLDMRKPRVHLTFENESNSRGVSTCIIGETSVQEVIQKSPLENLDYISSGPTPPNPSELLMRQEFKNLVEQLKELYDVIIFDTPPIGLVTDAIIPMKMSHVPIYVFRSDFSKKEFVKNLNRLMSINKFNNISLILNGVSSIGKNNYGYGYYDEDKNRMGKLKLRRD